LARQDQVGVAQGLEVKGQGVGWDAYTFRKVTRRDTFRASLNEQPINLQTTVLGERG
jgi:hypothetical protein